MRLRVFLAALSLGASAGAFADDPALTNWLELFNAVAERDEATWINDAGGSTNDYYWTDGYAYQRSSLIWTQRVVVDLGVQQSPWLPMICVTNGTNVVCWTNYVDLTSESRDPDDFFGWDPLEYGPQWATNMIWTNVDDRLEDFTLPSAITVTPDRASIQALDFAIWQLLPHFVDIDRMRRVPGAAELEDEALINKWFSTPERTNWYWVDTDGDYTEDQWVGFAQYPSNLPVLSVSSAWENAGIEVYKYPIGSETNSVAIYGWMTNQLGTYIVSSNAVISTNYFYRYGFEVSSTVTPWVARLGQVYWDVTNRTAWATTNVADGVTNVVHYRQEQIGPVPRMLGDAEWSAQFELPPIRLLYGPDGYATNYIRFIPPGVKTTWSSNTAPDEWALAFDATAFVDGTNEWIWGSSLTGIVAYTDLEWTGTTSAARALSLTDTNGSPAWLRNISSLVVTNWPATENLWSNDVLISAAPDDLIGTTLEVTLEGTSYELTGLPWPGGYYRAPSHWDLRMVDWSQRVAIVRQMQWMTQQTHPLNRRVVDVRGWQPEVSYDPWSVAPEGSEPPPVTPGYDSDESLTLYGEFSVGEDIEPWYRSKTWDYDENGDVYYYFTNHWGIVWHQREVFIYWQDLVTYALSNLSPRLNAQITWAGKVARDDFRYPVTVAGDYSEYPPREAWVVSPPRWPRTYTHETSYYDNDSNQIKWSNTLTQASDPLGPDELYATVRGSVPWEGGRTPLSIANFVWLDADPTALAWYSSYCDYPGRDDFWNGTSETLYWMPGADRKLYDETWIIRWEFDYLPLHPPDDAPSP